MELPIGRADVDVILTGIYDANVRLEKVIDFLEINGGEEEEDPDS